MAEWEANKEEGEEEDHVLSMMEEDQEEVVEEADEGQLLVLRRAMSGLKGEKEEQGRTFSILDAPFKGRCAH